MSKNPLTIEQAIDLLTTNLKQIAEFTADLTSAQLHTSPNPDEWSINDVLAHLRSCSDMWGNAIETILAQNKPTIRAINPRTWIKQTNYPEQNFQNSFHAFTKQRTDLLKVLEAIPSKNWSRSAIVTGAGKPLELTVLSYVNRLAIHERAHVKQIGRIAAGSMSE